MNTKNLTIQGLHQRIFRHPDNAHHLKMLAMTTSSSRWERFDLPDKSSTTTGLNPTPSFLAMTQTF